MSTRNKRIYKITVGQEEIVFYSRGTGERGKDIAAVKYALGDVYQVPVSDNSPNDTSIGTQWFSCEGSTPLSLDSLITFDKSLKMSLMNFQIKNQILILNYYWERMGIVKTISKEEDVYAAIQLSLNSFDSDFGRISEATIAILHGWRPSSTPSNRSFISAEEHPVEELPEYFYDLITRGAVSRPEEGTIRRIVARRRLEASAELIENFNNSSQEFKKWAKRAEVTNTYFFEYAAPSVQGSVVDSVLYVATQQTLSDLNAVVPDDLSASQRMDLIAKAVEPNHLTTKDPFEITNFKIGFFDKTEYTFQNLPEFENISLELRQSLENSALEKVLQHYKKKVPDQISPMLINFIDFRAPSLRPGDVYRAYFEVSKTRLDNLQDIEAEQMTSGTVFVPTSLLDLEEEKQTQRDTFCMDGEGLTQEQARIQYEKYRSFAAKKKLEISRKIRQAALRSQEDQMDIDGIEVDLGIFGKGTLTESEMTDMLTRGAGNILDAADNQRRTRAVRSQENQGEDGDLEISFPDLVARCESVSKNFATADEELKNNFVLEGDPTFSAKTESKRMATIPSDIESAIRMYEGTDSALRQVDAIEPKLKDILLRDDTILLIKFGNAPLGSKIKAISLKSPLFATDSFYKVFLNRIGFTENSNATQDRQYGRMKGSLLEPRSAHYLRNLEALSVKEVSFAAPCDDPFAQPRAAAYILQYTKGLREKKKPNEYNPYHNWLEQRKQDIVDGFKKRLPNQDDESPDSKIFKTTNPESAFGFEEALPLIGEECTPEDVELYLKKQLNLKKLLCEYVACLGLPDVQIQTPNIGAIDWPRLPTIELPGLDKDEYLDLLKSIGNRVLCTFVKGIIDILSTPFCQDKFIEGVYGAASDVSPQVQRAFADGFLSTGIPVEKTQSSKDFIDALMGMLSPRELCALFNGEPVNEEVYQVVQTLSESFGLQAEFSTRESIRDFFITIGVFVDPQICEDLSRYDSDADTCSDVFGLMNQLRLAAQRGENVPVEKIEEAALHAQNELASKAAALRHLGEAGSLQDLLPDLKSLENNPIFSTPEPIMQQAANIAARSALELAKTSFVTSVNSYVSSYYVSVPGIATQDDDIYNSEANMKVQRAVSNLQRFSKLNLNLSNLSELRTTLDLRRAVLILADDYEKKLYNNGKTPPFEVYTVKENMQEASDGSLISNSLLEKYNLEEESKPDSEVQQLSRLSELTPVWTYMLPLSAGELDERTRTMSTYLDWTKGIFKGQDLSGADIITLNTNYINKLNQLLQKLQEDISSNTEAAFVNKTDSEFLKGISEFYEITEDEVRNDTLIKVNSRRQDQIKTTLLHPVEQLRESTFVESRDETIPDPNGTPQDSRVLIRNNVSVKDDFFLGTQDETLNFSFCEEVPQHLRSEQSDTSARMNAYSSIIKDLLKSKYSEYSSRDANQAIEEVESLTSGLSYPGFKQAYEGTLEQMAYNVRSSRIFEDPDYLNRLDLKIRSKFYFDPSRGCYRNPNNLLKYGAISFDEMVTQLFPEQYMREYASPENSPLLVDYSAPGAFEKAMMSTSLVGFVRMCLTEMLLKGAICFSVWDIDFVKGNKFFREFMVEHVDRQIELQPFFTNNRQHLDETLARVSGTNNRSAALRKIVLSNADTIISDISKNLFENDARIDFSTWFLDTMHLVSVPEEKNSEGKWKSNILKDEVIQFRKNNFSFLENYIRIQGPLRDFNSSPAEIASSQYTKLRENFPNLQQIADSTNIALPNITAYDIANPDSIDINLFEDNDEFPNRELLSVGEFSEVIRSLLENNSELNRYIHDLTRKIHDPTMAFVHGLPKTMEDRMPAKAIVRTRTRYEFDGSNPFSAFFKESPSISSTMSTEAERADKFATQYETNKQKKDAYYFNVMTTGEEEPGYGLDGESETEIFSVLQESFKTSQVFDDRFYIQPGRAEYLLSETERLEDMSESELSNAELLFYESKVEDDNKLGPHEGHEFRSTTLPSRTQDLVTRDRPGGSGNRDMIFLNEAGKVSKEKFDTFTESNPDLEIETWEETVIDLIADASPIFNQPGNTTYSPESQMSDSDAADIGAALNRQLYFSYDASQTVSTDNGDIHLDRAYERNALLKATPETVEGFERRFVFKILESEGNMIRKAVPLGKFGQTSTEGWSRLPEKFYQTFASNEVRFEKSLSDNIFRVGEQELLDINEYKIPLRILITQIKDQSGNILKVFVKYVLPEFLNFEDTSLDNYRTSALKDAIMETLRSFERFNTDAFRRIMIEKFVNDPEDYDAYSGVFSDPSSPSTSNISPQRDVFTVLEQGVGSPAGPVPPIMRYPGSDLGGNSFDSPAHSSRVASWCSTSKFYSIACQDEANRHTGNFATSESHLDQQFSDPGRLLRRPNSLNYSFANFKRLMERKINSETYDEDLFTANVRNLFVNMKLQKHWLYENSAGALLSSFTGLTQDTIIENPARKTVQTIGNLVSWFNQRREDGFWGATNEGNQLQQASNFHVGPSLFYGDNRMNIASFTSTLHDISGGNGTEINDVLVNASTTVYNEGYAFGAPSLATGYVTLVRAPFQRPDQVLGDATLVTVYNRNDPQLESPNVRLGPDMNIFLNKTELRNTGIWMYPEEIDFDGEKLTSAEAQAMAQVIDAEEMADYKAHNVRNSLAHRQVAAALAGRYNAALEEIGLAAIIRDITTAYVSRLEGDEEIISDILADSEISYGMRIVMNSANTSPQHGVNNAIRKMWFENSQVTEEERVGDTIILDSSLQETEFFTLPIAQYEKPISQFECFLATSPYMFRRKLQQQEEFMKKSLAQTSAFKDFYEFTIPYKNFASMLSVHSISMLAGYGDMPGVLSSTKAALAAAFESMTVMDPYGEEDFGAVVSAADFSSAYGPLGPAGGSPPECLDFPDLAQWFELIMEMLQQYIKYFPSVILRGIADGIDPMYKEMKHHYLDCQIPDLRNASWAASSGAGKTPLGLRGGDNGDQESMYAPLIPAFPVDISKGVARAWSGDFSYLVTSIDKLVGYIYGGPLPLLDPSYAFKIPCLKVDQESPNSWEDYKIGNSGRYGHPITPISLLALQTLELPADLDLRRNLCPRITNAVPCEDELE